MTETKPISHTSPASKSDEETGRTTMEMIPCQDKETQQQQDQIHILRGKTQHPVGGKWPKTMPWRYTQSPAHIHWSWIHSSIHRNHLYCRKWKWFPFCCFDFDCYWQMSRLFLNIVLVTFFYYNFLFLLHFFICIFVMLASFLFCASTAKWFSLIFLKLFNAGLLYFLLSAREKRRLNGEFSE